MKSRDHVVDIFTKALSENFLEMRNMLGSTTLAECCRSTVHLDSFLLGPKDLFDLTIVPLDKGGVEVDTTYLFCCPKIE